MVNITNDSILNYWLTINKSLVYYHWLYKTIGITIGYETNG